MAWDVRQTYYYLVCFATLIMMIIGVVRAVESGIDLVLPEEPYRPTAIDMYQRTMRPTAPGDTTELFTREELEAMAEEESERMQQQQRRRAVRSLIGSLALILVAAPVYVYHWRRVRSGEEGDGQGARLG